MSYPVYSVVIPVYNEEQTLEEFYRRISLVMQQLNETYELIFVNDGSQDRSLQILIQKQENDYHIKLINFSRNFGQQIGITAGIDYSSGDAVIVIDADLQDPPEVILDMISFWKKGYQVVYARRIKRKGETWFKKISAKIFYRLLNSLSSISIPMDVGDFRLIDKVVVNALKEIRESNRFMKGLVSWIGFKQIAVNYIRDPRYAGETKYPLHKLVSIALSAIVSFSYKPLRFASYLGLFSALSGFAYMLVIIYQKFFTQNVTPGWTSIIAISIFYNGIILLMLGIMGEYIGRIFTECKQRPLYLIESTLGWDKNKSERVNDV